MQQKPQEKFNAKNGAGTKQLHTSLVTPKDREAPSKRVVQFYMLDD
jgi:hypothetical protein